VTDWKYVAVLAAGALMISSTQAQTGGPDIPEIKLSGFKETFLKAVPTAGGGPLVGATVGKDDPAYLLKPALFLPAALYSKWPALCVETVSIDGSYASHGEISQVDLESDHGVLRFVPNNPETRNAEGTMWPREILRFGPRNVAVLASVGTCGSDENRNVHTFALVDRSVHGSGDAAPRPYELYVNPKLADEVDAIYRRRDGREVRVPCQPAENTFHNTAFSRICELDGPFQDVTAVELVPSKFGRPLPSYRFMLVYMQGH
jgi:hypothetical protein